MAHEVFVSYPTADKQTADAVVHTLEAVGVRCWIAPRDIAPGTEFAAGIVEAIAASRLMVLVFSDAANDSNHILNEVREANDAGTPIIPFRTEEVDPSPALKYYIGGKHWLDALTEPLERHLGALRTTVTRLLGNEEPPVPGSRPESEPEIHPALTPQRGPTTQDPRPAEPVRSGAAPGAMHAPRFLGARVPLAGWIALGAVLAAALVAAVILLAVGGGSPDTTTAASTTTAPATAATTAAETSTTQMATTTAVPTTAAPVATEADPFASMQATIALANRQGPNFVCHLDAETLSCATVEDQVDRTEAVAAADFNLDGRTDLAFANALPGDGYYGESAHDRVCLRVDEAMGGWLCSDISAEETDSSAVAAGDLDSDGNPDLLIGTMIWRSPIPPQACRGDGEGTFTCGAFVEDIGLQDLDLGDLDGDGDADVVTVGLRASHVCTNQDSLGHFACQRLLGSTGMYTAVAIGTFDTTDLERRPGLFLAGGADRQICRYQGGSDPYACYALDPGVGAFSAVAVDLWGSATSEILVGGGSSDGAPGTRNEVCNVGPDAQIAADELVQTEVVCTDVADEDATTHEILVSDLDGDGDLDVLFVGYVDIWACLSDGEQSLACTRIGIPVEGLFVGGALLP